eukprot:8018460-Pyramimonas_sp.AAC.1
MALVSTAFVVMTMNLGETFRPLLSSNWQVRTTQSVIWRTMTSLDPVILETGHPPIACVQAEDVRLQFAFSQNAWAPPQSARRCAAPVPTSETARRSWWLRLIAPAP